MSTTTPEATSIPTTPLRTGTVPAEKRSPKVPCGNDVGQEGGTDEHTRDPETGEGTRSDGLGPLEGTHRPGLLEHAVGAGHVQQMHASAEDHAALEASPGCQVAVGDHVESDDDGDRQEEEGRRR